MGQLGLQLRSVEFQLQSLLLALQIFVIIVQAVLAAQQQKIRHDSLMTATPSSYVLYETDDQAKRQKALGPPKDKLLPSTKVSNLARESALAKETSELWPG